MFGQFPLFSVTGLAFALVIGLLIFFVKLYRHRMMFRKLPGPPHSFWFGHMPVLSKLRETLPKDSHGQIWMDALRKKYNLGKVFYLDSWPLDRPIMVVLDPEIANIITTRKNLPKDPDLMRLIGPVLGPESLVVQHGQRWKSLRMMFNPGFSPTHLMTLAPMIVDTTAIFYNVLRAHAEKGDIFPMDEAAVNYTIDIIGKVAMNVEFNAQTTDNEVVGVFRTLLKWLPKPKRISPFNELHPKRIYILWKNVRYTNKYLGDLLESRFLSKNDRSSRSEERTVIDLALNSYLEMNPSAKESKTLDPRFKISAIDQLKSFLFAGHDTSGTMIAYAFHLLAKNPEARARMCKELDEVLDPDMALSAKEIKENPHILNNLPYTTAVLKETLRLYPPASSMRTGSAKGDFVTDPETHAVYPTYGFRVWPVSHGMGRDPDLFPDPNSFWPERFLPDSPFAPRHKDAWRPFEKGPRNCIGQELAMLEGRIAMALTARYFGFKTAYPKVSEEERRKGAPLEVDGEQCYQILAGVAKPKAGMPCRVWKVKQR